MAGWQNQGYASYIVARTNTEKVGLIDWRIGKEKKKTKKKKKGKKRTEKKREGEKRLSLRIRKSTLKKMRKATKTMISGIRYVHHLLEKMTNHLCFHGN